MIEHPVDDRFHMYMLLLLGCTFPQIQYFRLVEALNLLPSPVCIKLFGLTLLSSTITSSSQKQLYLQNSISSQDYNSVPDVKWVRNTGFYYCQFLFRVQLFVDRTRQCRKQPTGESQPQSSLHHHQKEGKRRIM